MGIDLQLVRCLIFTIILDNDAICANFGLQKLCKSKRISKLDCFADGKFSVVGFVFVIIQTRSSANADNTLDAFSGQSRSTNIVPFHVTYSFLLCNSNLSLRRAVFTIFDFEKCRDLEMGVKGHSRSLRVASFDRLCMVSY